MKRITIIGSGTTGTLLAVNLIKHSDNQTLEINLVDKNERLGRGVAYSTAKDFHLLNVPANKMGAFPDDLEHFYQWLTANCYDFFVNDFVPRRLYGEYLRELFCQTVAEKPPNVAVNLLDDEAVDDLQAANKLQILKGRLKDIEPCKDGKLDVSFSTDGVENNLSVGAIINCIGSQSNFTKIGFPLVKNLVGRGVIKTDTLALGIDALPDGRTIDRSGAISDKIFTVGTALKGILWESTALPEIRAQTSKLALSLLNGG